MLGEGVKELQRLLKNYIFHGTDSNTDILSGDKFTEGIIVGNF